MFPIIALAALASGLASYQYSKNKYKNKGTDTAQTTLTAESDSDKKAANVYNYYTNEQENGNTLFGSQKKTKRTLFGID